MAPRALGAVGGDDTGRHDVDANHEARGVPHRVGGADPARRLEHVCGDCGRVQTMYGLTQDLIHAQQRREAREHRRRRRGAAVEHPRARASTMAQEAQHS